MGIPKQGRRREVVGEGRGGSGKGRGYGMKDLMHVHCSVSFYSFQALQEHWGTPGISHAQHPCPGQPPNRSGYG